MFRVSYPVAIFFGIVTVLVAADGLFMTLTKYHPDDVNGFSLSDGGTILLSAGIMAVVTIIAFVLAARTGGSTSAKGPEAKA